MLGSIRSKSFFLLLIAFACTRLVYSYGPIAQDLAYHNFADQRSFFGIPNFLNIISNALFIIFGILALKYVLKHQNSKRHFKTNFEFYLWVFFFISASLVGIGSCYYHLNPTNDTLVWDRLPMSLAFMSLFAAIITETISPRVGRILFPFLLALGVFSVFYWILTESLGQGDLRLYILVQFFPLIAIPFLGFLFRSPYPNFRYIMGALGCYGLAKFFEEFDTATYTFTNEFISGHSLKHIAAAFGILFVLSYLKSRQR